MKKSIYITLLLVFIGQVLIGQGVRGTIKDSQGTPLAYATIFVKETGTGTITNEEGLYEVRLSPGNYTLVFQFLGYATNIQKVSTGDLFKEINVTLKDQTLELKAVEVYEGREDPAYTVMRKAIAKASYHRQQLDSYQAQVYTKGSGRLKKAPFFLRKRLAKEGIDSSVAFTTESVSKIEYQRPNTFKETVISIRTQGDDNSTSPNEYINGSFYEPELGEAISPLSPKAFGYYKFKLAGYFYDRGYAINKIKVIPRSRGENVFEGDIYIVEDWWSIYSLSLKTYKFGIGFQIEQVYAPIEEKAWMPVSHQFEVTGKVFGFAFEYNYLATVKDYNIELNPDLPGDFTVIDEKLEQELAAEIKNRRKDENEAIQEKLSTGKELTRKELRKIIKEYEKQERKQQEEPEVVVNTSLIIDSMAYKRDSLYWEEIRPIPLTKYEVKGYRVTDSLAVVEAEKEKADTLNQRRGGQFSIGDLFFGNTYRLSKNNYLSLESTLGNTQFNPVEGYSIHTDLRYYIRKSRRTRFAITLTPRYAFARKKLSGKGRLSFNYGKRERPRQISLEGGRYISQFNEQNPISPFINTLWNLIGEQNYIRLYEKDFFRVSSSSQSKKKVILKTHFEWAKRFRLFNNTSQTWFNRDDRSYDTNELQLAEAHLPMGLTEKVFNMGLSIEAKPWQKYRIRNGRKIAIENSSPTLIFGTRLGVPNFLESEGEYQLLEFTYRHNFKIGARGRINMKVNTGFFIDNKRVPLADYKHFPGNRTFLVTADPVGSFRLLDYYRHSTNDKFLAAHVHYQFRKFLFTQIPEVWLLGVKENLFVNYLATPSSQNYFEVGYSIDNIFRVFRVEAAASFQNGKYQDFGILIGIASNLGFISFD